MNKACKGAMWYAQKKGWNILPLKGKVPTTAHGFKDATTSDTLIANWFTQEQNVGIRTGKESGIVVVDIDPRNGGDDSWTEICPEEPSTIQVKTGSGGSHYYFKYDGSIKYPKELAPGIDIKSDGGYVVAPPSIHPETGLHYEWVNRPDDTDTADLPEWIVALCKPKKPLPGLSGNEAVEQEALSSLARLVGEVAGPDENYEYKSLCPHPDHKDSAPSFCLNFNKGVFYCFGCDWSGSIAEMLRFLRVDAPDKFTPFSISDALEERPPVTWLVDGVIPAASLSIVYGSPGSMKTMLMMDMCAQVVRGGAWLTPRAGGYSPKSTTESAVLWVDLDNGTRRTHDRVAAFSRAYDLGPSDPFHYLSMPSPWIDISKEDSVMRLRDLILEADIKMMVIDNLSAVRGRIEENSADMVRIMQPLRVLCESTECAINVIHHENKSTEPGRRGHRLRGHSSIEGAIDLALLVNRDEGSRFINVSSTKTRDVDVVPFGAEFAYEWASGTKDMRTARFFGHGVVDERNDTGYQEAIFNVVSEKQPIWEPQLIKAVYSLTGCSHSTIGILLNDMKESGALSAVNITGNNRYTLPMNHDQARYK